MTANGTDFVSGAKTALMATTMSDATTMHYVLEDPSNMMGLPLVDAAAGSLHALIATGNPPFLIFNVQHVNELAM
jgi:hypothetical protein